jgi:hypothetical protein
MQVRIVVANTLACFADDDFVPEVVMAYRDRRSVTVTDALDQAWRICNAAHHRLDEAEQRLRAAWDACAGGLALSVGDVVEVDGNVFVCAPDGWSNHS